MRKELTREQREKFVKGSARWFYWIAGITILNTILLAFQNGGNLTFGLVSGQFIDGFFSEANVQFKIVGYVLNALLAAGLIYIGISSAKKKKKLLQLGILFLLFDATILLPFKDYKEFAWHMLPILFLTLAYRNLNRLEQMSDELDELGKDILVKKEELNYKS